jgi:hypothetical protein
VAARSPADIAGETKEGMTSILRRRRGAGHLAIPGHLIGYAHPSLDARKPAAAHPSDDKTVDLAPNGPQASTVAQCAGACWSRYSVVTAVFWWVVLRW